MGARLAGSVTKHLRTTTTVETFEPYTDWMPATGLDTVQMVIKRKSVQLAGTAPTFNVKPAIQVAEVRTNNPSDWATIAGVGPFSGPGESNTALQDISAVTEGNFFVRFGVSYYLGGTAPTYGQADVDVQVAYRQWGSIVGTTTKDLVCYNTTTDSWVSVTGWIPAISAVKVVAAFVLSDVTGNFRCLLGYRKAATSTQVPSEWASLEGTSYRNANSETCTDEISLSIGGEMYVQFGVAYSQSSASSTPGQGTVTTAIAVRQL